MARPRAQANAFAPLRQAIPSARRDARPPTSKTLRGDSGVLAAKEGIRVTDECGHPREADERPRCRGLLEGAVAPQAMGALGLHQPTVKLVPKPTCRPENDQGTYRGSPVLAITADSFTACGERSSLRPEDIAFPLATTITVRLAHPRRHLLQVSMFVLLLCGLHATAADQQDDAWSQALQTGSRKAVAAVEAVYGITLQGKLTFQLVSNEEIWQIHARVFGPALPMQGDNKQESTPGKPEDGIGRDDILLYGLFDPESNHIYVCPQNIASRAKEYGRDATASEDTLIGTVVHECAHAADAELYNWPRIAKSLRDKDRQQRSVYVCIVEGNAQRMAEDICREKHWPFFSPQDVYELGITRAATAGARPWTRGVRMTLAQALHLSYYLDGEAFMRAIHRKGGAEAIKKAFLFPPAEFAVLAHPEWFTTPGGCPTPRYNYDKALTQLSDTFASDNWKWEIVSPCHGHTRTLLRILPPTDTEKAIDGVLRYRLFNVKSQGIGPVSTARCTYYETRSPADAALLMLPLKESTRRWVRVSEGRIAEIAGLRTGFITRTGLYGDWTELTIPTPPGYKQKCIIVVLVVRDCVCCEAVFEHVGWTPEQCVNWVVEGMGKLSPLESSASESRG